MIMIETITIGQMNDKKISSKASFSDNFGDNLEPVDDLRSYTKYK